MIAYASPTGNNGNDGLSWATAKADLFSALASLGGIGEVHFAENTPASAIAGGGLKIRGSYDPGPGGSDWIIQAGPVRFIGHGCQKANQFSAGVACVRPGGGAAAFAAQAVWLAGTDTVTFDNVGIVADELFGGMPPVDTPIVTIGRSSAGNGAGALTANTWVRRCSIGTGEGGYGPALDIGNVVWLWIEVDTNILASDGGTQPDTQACVTIKPDPSVAGDGLIYFRKNTRLSGGGVRMHAGQGAELTMESVLQENAKAPVFWGNGSPMQLFFRDVQQADVVAAGPGIVIPAGAVATAIDCCPVQGGANVIGGTLYFDGVDANGHISAAAKNQTGILNGKLVGPHDGGRFNLSPSVNRYPNIATTQQQWPWATPLTACKGPDGILSAWQCSYGATGLLFAGQSLVVGDYYVFGAWFRATTADASGQFWNGEKQLNLVNVGSGNVSFYQGSLGQIATVPAYSSWLKPYLHSSGGEWVFVSEWVRITAADAGSVLEAIWSPNDNLPMQMWRPCACHVPAGDGLTDDDIATWAQHLVPGEIGAPVGVPSCRNGLALWDAAANAWRTVTVSNGQLVVT